MAQRLQLKRAAAGKGEAAQGQAGGGWCLLGRLKGKFKGRDAVHPNACQPATERVDTRSSEHALATAPAREAINGSVLRSLSAPPATACLTEGATKRNTSDKAAQLISCCHFSLTNSTFLGLFSRV